MRTVVGSRKGMASWAGQGLTALVMIAALAYLLVAYAVTGPSGHEGLRGFLSADFVRVPASVGAVALIWHAWLGAKSVVMDYIKWPWLRTAKYVGLVIYLMACMVWFIGLAWSL